jgi:hypothetical protein
MPGMLLATMARTQPGGASATALGADGVTWGEAAAGVARFQGTARRLLIEPARINQIRNPRLEAATVGVIGSGGALPANMTMAANGMVRTVVGTGVENGVAYVDLRFSGTATGGGGSSVLTFEGATTMAALNGQSWTCGYFCRLAGGSFANISTCYQSFYGKTSGGVQVAGQTFTTSDKKALIAAATSLGAARWTITGTLTDPTVAFVQSGMNIGFGVGTAIDVTLRIGWPQAEIGGYASTPILPPVGAPAAAARNADMASVALTGAPCTLLWSGALAAAAGSADQRLVGIDTGADTDLCSLVNPAGGSTICARHVTASAAVTGASAGSMVAGTLFRAGLTVSGGRVAACLNGGPVAALTGGPAGPFTTARLGNNLAGTIAMGGETAWWKVLPAALPDAALQAAVAGLPIG